MVVGSLCCACGGSLLWVSVAGIGVAYSTQKDAFRFNVVSRLGVGGVQYCAVLRRVLDEMRDTVTAATTPMRSRL